MGRPSIPPGGQGAPSVKEVKRGLWTTRLRWRDQGGAYHETVAEGRTRELALAAIAERVAMARDEIDAATERHEATTFEDAAKQWLDDLTAEGEVRGSTVRQYRDTWKGTLSPVFGTMLVNDATRADLQRGLRGLRRRDRNGVHILDENGRTVPLVGRQPRAVLMMLLGWAVDEGIREDGINPLAGTRRRRGAKKRADAFGPRILTGAEWTRLHGLAESSTRRQNATRHLPDVLVLLRWTGVRIGEALALRWEDVDLGGDVPTVTICRTLVENGPGLNTGDTKGTEVRVIALHNDLVDMLEVRKSHATGSPWVFANGRGGDRPVTTSNLRRRLRAAICGTDLSWVHPHTFRHSLATAASKALDDEAAADLLGHADSAVTKAHYIRKDAALVLDPRNVFDDE